MRSASVRPRSAPRRDAFAGGASGAGASVFRVTAIALWSGLLLAPDAMPADLEVDRSAVDGHRRFADHFGERRVRVGRRPDLPRRRLERERERGLGDEIGRMWTDDVDPQRVTRLRVGDHLGKALVLTPDDRLRDRLERDLADLELVSLLPS